MPSIGRIQSTNFQALLDTLGITRNNIPFNLRSEVSPVVLVGGTVSFIAPATPAYRVPDLFTAGVQVNPADGDLLADTGQLPVGAYTLFAFISGSVDHNFHFQWRDSPNTADLFTNQFFNVARNPFVFGPIRFDVLNANERFRIEQEGALVGSVQASISVRI